jgi:hypothetical protein
MSHTETQFYITSGVDREVIVQKATQFVKRDGYTAVVHAHSYNVFECNEQCLQLPKQEEVKTSDGSPV